jgi:hypothetical protein
VESGAALDTAVSKTVTLENRGLAAMTAVSLSLVTPGGDPAPLWAVLNDDFTLLLSSLDVYSWPMRLRRSLREACPETMPAVQPLPGS